MKMERRGSGRHDEEGCTSSHVRVAHSVGPRVVNGLEMVGMHCPAHSEYDCTVSLAPIVKSPQTHHASSKMFPKPVVRLFTPFWELVAFWASSASMGECSGLAAVSRVPVVDIMAERIVDESGCTCKFGTLRYAKEENSLERNSNVRKDCY